ncbi:MAG: transpeptidase family protein [Gemmatimonadetes bacterium]|nr:transpeptidase family protein [Gemmatimonadota bacterium]
MRRARRDGGDALRTRRSTGSPGDGLRRAVLLGGIMTASLAVIARSVQFSVIEHGEWRDRAEDQHADTLVIPAPRGTILDRDGVPLAASREVWLLAVAPREVVDTPQVVERLVQQAGLTVRRAGAIFDGQRSWVVLPGRFEESTRAALDHTRGIHFERALRRFYPHDRLAAELLGRVNMQGDVAGGLEQELNEVLSGRSGLAVARIDPDGRPIPGAMLRVIEPAPGHDVVLTLDADLQEIAQQALALALDSTGAASGEMVIADPHTGEILAAVSRTGDRAARSWTAATVPYEPGSTIKPFTMAALLASGRATLADSVFGEDGSYRVNGRTITDVHPYGWLTLREGFLVSSNIILAKAASRLSRSAQYDRLRTFGFGTPTGLRYPSESGGRLRPVAEWSKQSQASLAFGYELSVTPLQLVLAYGSIANGGILMEPVLVREVRARDGRVLQSMAPRAVRRVMPASVAEDLRELLIAAVEQGTGQRAAMGELKVAGKTGTARLAVNGRYQVGSYISTFAGFFPADDPQLVFLVKLDRPKGEYYGGQTAAPVTRATLLAALAAKGTPFDRRAVAHAGDARVPGANHAEPDRPAVQFVHVAVEDAGARAAGAQNALAAPAARVAPVSVSVPRKTPVVPDVTGLLLREAVRRLHTAGLRVRVAGTGRVRATTPSAAAAVRAGTTVRVSAGGGR